MPTQTWSKVLPLGAMFFCILFNYTILRDTKDVLVVTAPGSGAEVRAIFADVARRPYFLPFQRVAVFEGLSTAPSARLSVVTWN